MLYCDLLINNVPLWSGVLCLNQDAMNFFTPQEDFVGLLFFNDTQGSDDPDYTGIGPGGRFQLVYDDLQGNQQGIPLLAVANQNVQTSLGTQSVSINLYTATATMTT